MDNYNNYEKNNKLEKRNVNIDLNKECNLNSDNFDKAEFHHSFAATTSTEKLRDISWQQAVQHNELITGSSAATIDNRQFGSSS